MSEDTVAASKRRALERVERFRNLNDEGPLLVLPGAWDFVSARLLAIEGFPCLGTTSTGICWSLGRYGAWDPFLAASERIVTAVEVPVSLDIEAGFSRTPEGVAEHVRQVIATGACGINLEDGLLDGGLGDAGLHAEKIRAARQVTVSHGYPLYINARTDVFLGGGDDVAEAVRRGQLYAEAGADMFFAPGIREAADITELVNEVPIPLNVYASAGVPATQELAALGVRRLSVGCGLLQSALAKARNHARELFRSGSCGFVDAWLPFEEVEALCAR